MRQGWVLCNILDFSVSALPSGYAYGIGNYFVLARC
jgi:hypothetical protein